MRRTLAALASCAAWAVVSGATRPALADSGSEAEQATFALIVGNNTSPDPGLPALKYADDDAADYLDVFRALGARTYVLTRPDENTRRLHPQAAAEAIAPTNEALTAAVDALASDVAMARARGVSTIVYFVYAGHGGISNGQGYVTLEDARLTGSDLAARIVSRIAADRIHFVVDACGSYFLAYGRGPGGERRPVGPFVDGRPLAGDPRVGLLLSTSSARESHEWEGFQAGVFSHEVRSALLGAADADGDGRLSYREVAAFVQRANAAIPNERFRPDVHAHAPSGSDTLVDLRRVHARRVDVDGAHAGRYFIEDDRGVRVADFHNDASQPVSMVLPAGARRYFARRIDDDVEYTLPASPEALALADLTPSAPRAGGRGAAHEAFGLLFSLPFDRAVVTSYQATEPPGEDLVSTADRRPSAAARMRHELGWASIAVGGAGLAMGIAAWVVATNIAKGGSPSDSQVEVVDRNSRIATYREAAAWSLGAGGAAVAAGAVLLLWPGGSSHAGATISSTGVTLTYRGAF